MIKENINRLLIWLIKVQNADIDWTNVKILMIMEQNPLTFQKFSTISLNSILPGNKNLIRWKTQIKIEEP